MTSIFEIDPNICKARTLASEFYTDPRYFDQSKDKIFARTWQFLAKSDEFDGLKPVTLLPGFLDEPILLSKNLDRVACLSNVCTHRGKILVDEECKANLIRCGYHGRRFSLDGKFLSMPEFEGVEDFPSEDDNLRHIPVAARAGFLFTSIDPTEPFDAFVSEAALRLEDIEPNDLKLVSSQDYEVSAHWALYCENYLEGFHIPFVHQSLNEIVDYGSYKTETFRYSSMQTGFDSQGNVAGRYLFVFPNLMFNFYPWGISINIVNPVTPDRSIVSFVTYISDESKLKTGAGADLHRVELEDEAVVQSVQKGIRSRFYSHGRYSPSREQGTHHFHRLIAEFMK
jgi:Phenylpropionate dioxygenase and related ring-hydroxylating dioxygenases, large terminal subunit